MAGIIPPHRRRSIDEPINMKSCRDATEISSGPPTIYQLNTERIYVDATDQKVRRWIYRQKDRKKQNKVILLVGETGAGKTTLINTITNYLLGVKFEDQEFYQITEEEHEDQSVSQTSDITVYEVFVEENRTSLTIIDTPGYANTEGYEKDRQIAEYLMKLFSSEDGIHYIDAVCFVIKACQNRLSDKDFYIFHAVQSLFGSDIENNIMFLLTYSYGGRPTDALNAIEKAEIPCRRDEDNQPVHFLFNNQQKEKRDKKYDRDLKSAWERGDESMKEMFTLLKEKNRKPVRMTLEVLKERRRLEACVSNLRDRINEKELKMKELNQIQEALTQNKDKIEKCEEFQFTVTKTYKEKVPIVNEWLWNSNATCCSVCEENCHEWECSLALNASQCWVMKNKHCTVCTGKCHYSTHIKENKKYEIKTKDVVMTFDDLKREYECTGKKPGVSFDKQKYENTKEEQACIMKVSECKREIDKKLNSELKKIEKEKSDMLNEAYLSINSLSKIALKADSAFTLQHLDFLIPRMKEEGKEEWVKKLEDLKKAGEKLINKRAVQHVKNSTGQNRTNLKAV